MAHIGVSLIAENLHAYARAIFMLDITAGQSPPLILAKVRGGGLYG